MSRFDGHYEHVFETTTAGVTIQAPQLDINTVAAGGGSMLFYKNGMFVVGPEVISCCFMKVLLLFPLLILYIIRRAPVRTLVLLATGELMYN